MQRRDAVFVQNYQQTKGETGQNLYTVPDGEAVRVPCNVYPVDADTITAYGLQEVETRLIVCDMWPGNIHSTVAFEGVEWDVAAPVQNFDKTPSARSVQVVVKKRQ